MNICNKKIGIIGIGFVGAAILKSYQIKNIDVVGYDKFKNGYVDTFDDILNCDIVFLCLPTLFDETNKCYDKSTIYEVCSNLVEQNYSGIIVLKSTVEPETTNILSSTFTSLQIFHNPEFLTARTAFEDFHNQTHIVIGVGPNCIDSNILNIFYSTYYPQAEISVCSALESESMKIFCNSFYASKIILFNEYYSLCQKNGADFNNIKSLMLKNNWINPMHTDVPGTDGKLGFGGACFPKDTKALLSYMKQNNSQCAVLENVVDECECFRNK